MVAKTPQSLGPNTNIEAQMDGSILTLRIDTAKDLGRETKSGKSKMIATTGPGIEVAPGLKLGLNLYKKL